MTSDPDAAPTVERTRFSVRTWGDLEPGDVLRTGGLPATISRIEPSPIVFDVQARIDELNEQNRGKTVTVIFDGAESEIPAQEVTILDLMDRGEWKDLIADPRQLDIWATYPGWRRERRMNNALDQTAQPL